MVGDIFQPTHLLFVLVVALLVLGPKRLPEVGRTLGSGIRDFRQALSGETHDRSHRSDSEEPTELGHQYDATAEGHIDWPEEAVGPTSFDEPVEAASAEPTTTASAVSEPLDATHVGAGTQDAGTQDVGTEDAGTQDAGSTQESASGSAPASAPGLGAMPEQDLAFSEHELARQTAESGASPEPRPDSRD
jgi:sec-independent protein translocase protein TatA